MASPPGLEDLFNGIDPALLDTPCSELHLAKLSQQLTSWKVLRPYLELTPGEEDSIAKSHPGDVETQKVKFLQKWSNKFGQGATYRVLAAALHKLGNSDLASKCCRMAKSASHQSQSVPSSVVPTYVAPNIPSFAQAPSGPWPGNVTRSPAPPYPVPMSYATPGSTPSYPPPPTPFPYTSTWFHGNMPYQPASIPMNTNVHASPSALVSYQKQIRYDYRTSNPVMALEWPPPPTLKYISLAMIKQKKLDRGEITDSFIRMTIHGDTDDILHDKVPVEVEQLFSLDTSERKVILVEGAPGSGKSTLLWHTCQKWQSGELFQQFTLVLLVLLRDTAVHNAKCLADILPYLPDDCSQSSELRDSIATQIRASYGEGVLIMLDGWDEAPHSLQQEGSLIHNIITGPSKCALQKAAIVVSSRPKASAHLWPYASTRVEVIGFTKKRRNEYIQESIENLATAQKLMQQIEDIPQLGQNCHLPLNLAIITNTFLCSKNELPSTYCRTIITLALNCLLRHFKKIGYKSIEALESFSNIPDSLKEQFVMLCRIAYEGVACQKYSFSKQFLSDQGRGSCEVKTFGLLQAVNSLVSRGSSTVYHFLHLSLQELCAAYYITSLSDTEEQIMKLKRLKTITTVVDTEIIGMSKVKVERTFERRNPRFDPVCQFYAALTQLSNSRVLAALMDEYPPLNVSHGFLNCLYEAQNPSLVKELDVTALKVTGDTSPNSLALAYLISIATGLKKFTYSKSSGIFSMEVFLEAVVADALSKSTVEEVICEEVSFSCTDSHPQSLSMMLKSKKLKKLEMHECFRDQLFPFSALLNGSIEDLTVSSSNIDASIMFPVLEKLLLKRLNISCCGIGYTSMEAISTIPIACTTLKQFNISGNYIGDIGADYLAKALVQTSLEELDISDCQIRNDGIIAIASALKATRTLISIDMHGNSFGTEGILAIAEALNHTSLQKLDIRYCDLTGEKGLLAIALALRSNTTLNYLAISESEGVYMEFIRTSIVRSLMENPRFISVYVENHLLLTDELQAKLLTKDMLSIHMIYFPSTIHFNLTTSSPLKEAFCSGNLETIVDILGLQRPPVRTGKLVIHFRYGENETIIDFSQQAFIKLPLQHCQLYQKSLQYLSTTPYCHHLKYLDISGNHIGHLEAALVATILDRNPVEFLSISDCSIDSVGMESICSAIKNSSILKSLNISGNRIGHSEAVLVATILHRNPIEFLSISDCSIDSVGMECIYSAIKNSSILKSLNISGNCIGHSKAALVATILHRNPIEFLSISDCSIDSVGMESICSAIKTSSTIKSLNISKNRMNYVKLPSALTTMLSQTPLKELDMSHCDLREDTLTEVCTALSTNTTLTHLRLGGNYFILSKHATSKLILILTSTPLEVIDIHGYYIAEDSMDDVYSALSTSTTITSILLPNTINYDQKNIVLESIFEALRHNKSLTDLRLRFNRISHIAASHLATLLERLSLREINIGSCSKEGSSMKQFVKVLIHNSTLTQLTLRGYSISHRCAIILAELLEQSSLHKLDISNCYKERNVMETLCQALTHSNRLTHLRLDGNDIGHSSMSVIFVMYRIEHLEAALVATILRRNPVEFLSISDFSIDSVGMESICSAIKTSSTLKSLNISKNKMNDVKLPSALATILSQTPLKELDMSHCDLKEDTLTEVCTALSTNTTLTHLRLGGGDFIVSKHATSKLILILTSTPLEVIDIHGCSIAEDSMDEVYSTLSTSTTITSILLPNTRNYDQKNIVLDAIFEALRHNKSLTDLRLRVNRISHIAASHLATLLERLSLREIDIGSCSKEGSSMKQFVEVLIHNSALTQLTIRGYSISHGCAIVLAELLEQSSLHKLDISNCDKEGSVMETLCKPLIHINRLTHLTLSGNYISSRAVLYLSIIMRQHLDKLDIRRCDIAESGLGWLCEALVYNVKRFFSAKIIVSSDTYRTITTVARAIEYSDDPQERMHRNERYYQTDQLNHDAMYYLYRENDHSREVLMLVERSLTIDDSDS